MKGWVVDTYYGYKTEKADDGTLILKPDAASGAEGLYQIPVIRYSSDDYGTYRVTITPTYSKIFDRNKDQYNEYDFYLDAVRVYSPAKADEIQVIQEAYVQDGEYNPEYKEIREIVVNAGSFEEPHTKVYVDGYGEATWENYRDVGPSMNYI